MATRTSIPVIDISRFEAGGSAADSVIEAVKEACEQHGFFVVLGHGIPAEVNQQMDAAARSFFHRPVEEKAAYTPGQGDVLRGWWGVGSMATATSITETGTKSRPAWRAGPPGYRATR